MLYKAIGGNMHWGEDSEIRFNKVLRANPTSPQGAILVNEWGSLIYRIYVYRNTFDGSVIVEKADTGDGPFYFYSNVIVNETGEADGISCNNCTDETVIILGTGETANLVGNASDAIIDVNGDLTEAYSSYLGTHGYQTTASTPAGTSTAKGMTGVGFNLIQ